MNLPAVYNDEFATHSHRFGLVMGYVDGCRINTVDGGCILVHESYDNVMFQICNNRKPEETEL